MLGYNEEKELIGRSAYQVFHHSYEDGAPVPRSADFLSQCYAKGGQIPGWQTVFWTATRRSIPVECTVYPMQIDGQREGSVIARWARNHEIALTRFAPLDTSDTAAAESQFGRFAKFDLR